MNMEQATQDPIRLHEATYTEKMISLYFMSLLLFWLAQLIFLKKFQSTLIFPKLGKKNQTQ